MKAKKLDYSIKRLRYMNKKNKQTGQASVEYLVVVMVIFLAFTVPLPSFEDVSETEQSGNAFEIVNDNQRSRSNNPTVVEWLVNVLKRNYEAYSYGISIAELPERPPD